MTEKNKALTVRLPMGLYDQVAEKAERSDSTVAGVVRSIIEESFYTDRVISRIDDLNRQMTSSVFLLLAEVMEGRPSFWKNSPKFI